MWFKKNLGCRDLQGTFILIIFQAWFSRIRRCQLFVKASITAWSLALRIFIFYLYRVLLKACYYNKEVTERLHVKGNTMFSEPACKENLCIILWNKYMERRVAGFSPSLNTRWTWYCYARGRWIWTRDTVIKEWMVWRRKWICKNTNFGIEWHKIGKRNHDTEEKGVSSYFPDRIN